MADGGQIDRILDHLYISGKKGAKNRGALGQRNIRHIINMTPSRDVDEVAGCPNFFESDKDLSYMRCSLFDSSSEDIGQFFDSCIAFIQKGRAWGNILVHCNRGVSRSGSIVIAYLMKRKGLSLKEAIEYTKLGEYEERLKKERENSDDDPGPSSPLLSARNAAASQPHAVNQGMQLPPHLQHLANAGSDEEESATPGSKVAAQSLGPSLPPHLQHLANQTDVADSDEVKKPEAANIGPQLPPHLQHLLQPSTDESSAVNVGDEPSPKRAKV